MPARRILIVDDDPRNRRLEEALLRAEGYQVSSADSGAAALAALEQTRPDLILLDLMMPGMDGFEFIARLRAAPEAQAVPIVLVTALDDAGSRARARAAGVADALTKPLDRWVLKACLTRLLGGPDADA